jgi:TatD DNase family protein
MELIDSHCHIDFPDLAGEVDALLDRMKANSVIGAVCISVRLEDLPGVLRLAESHPNLWATVGVHPDSIDCRDPTAAELVELAAHPKVIAIGETGLDYFRQSGDVTWQQTRFRNHIRAAIGAGIPLVVHTRSAAGDTLRILHEEGASAVGGIMHCFTESHEVALAAVELGFYISFSGIVSFKNAVDLKRVAAKLPLDRILVETDSPYLAPVPHRGKTNEPAFVLHVAEAIAEIRGVSLETVAAATSANFRRLFPDSL